MPGGYFSPLAPKLQVMPQGTSLRIWCDRIGFAPAYDLPNEGFAYLQHLDGAQMMLSRCHEAWETGPLVDPFRRGTVFQIVAQHLDAVLARCEKSGHQLHQPQSEVWRAYSDRVGGRPEIALQDPDGYLALLCQPIGFRLLPA